MTDLATAVQHQWATRPADERFASLDNLEAAVASRRTRSLEFKTDSTRMQFQASPDGDVQLLSRRTGVISPSHWSFGQTAALVGAPSAYLRKLPAPLAAQCLNHGVASRSVEGVKLMVIDPPDTEKTLVPNGTLPLVANGRPILQAVTSQTYGRIWDADVVHAARRIVDYSTEHGAKPFFNPKEWGGQPGGLYGSDHDVFLFFIDGGSIVDGGGDRDQMNRGWFMWNSEVGASIFGIASFLFRFVCGNYMIHGMEGVKLIRIRHTSGGPERFVNEALPALQEYVQASAKPVEAAVRKAKALLLPVDTTEHFDFFAGRNFTKAEINRAIASADREEGGHQTLWQMINGFTASARDMAYVDARIDLQRRAGKLLEQLAA
jgi:Domain of unknown function (DUF932)